MDLNYFDEMSAWDKLVALYSGSLSGAKFLGSHPKAFLEHSQYPEELKLLMRTYNPEMPTNRVDRNPLDKALNYGGGYQFGQTSGMPYQDSENLAKAYQLKSYLADKYLNNASPSRLKDASLDYYENLAGLRQAYADKAANKPYENIRNLSVKYGLGK